jgi:hypothetical protein
MSAKTAATIARGRGAEDSGEETTYYNNLEVFNYGDGVTKDSEAEGGDDEGALAAVEFREGRPHLGVLVLPLYYRYKEGVHMVPEVQKHTQRRKDSFLVYLQPWLRRSVVTKAQSRRRRWKFPKSRRGGRMRE